MGKLDLAVVKKLVQEFCRYPQEAQMVTIDRHGMPVGRTLAAELQFDWSVDMLTYPFFGRVKHLQRNPRMLLIWVEAKQPGKIYPRAVFARGTATILNGEPVVKAYAAKIAKGDHLPHVVSPDMKVEMPRELSPEEANKRMVLIRFLVEEIRAEGFLASGDAPLDPNELLVAQTWRPEHPRPEPSAT